MTQEGDYITVKTPVHAHGNLDGESGPWLKPGTVGVIYAVNREVNLPEIYMVSFLSMETGRMESAPVLASNARPDKPHTALVISDIEFDVPSMKSYYLPKGLIMRWADDKVWALHAKDIIDRSSPYEFVFIVNPEPALICALVYSMADMKPELRPTLGYIVATGDLFHKVIWHPRLIAEVEVLGGVATTSNDTNVWIDIQDYDEEEDEW